MSLREKIDTFANIATVALAVILAPVLVKIYLLPARSGVSATAQSQISEGVNLNGKLPDVDWAKNGRTLLLAISTECHFCGESEPFYRRLNQEVGKAVKIVALVPQPASEAQKFLETEGVHVDLVKQLALGFIGVRATPTMILVNGKGVVTRIWTGRVPDSEQQAVVSVLKRG